MNAKLDCDALDLLDEANALSLAVVFDERKVRRLVENLRHCADEAHAAGMTDLEHRMRKAADELQLRVWGKGPPR
jgi:hypothetical protein